MGRPNHIGGLFCGNAENWDLFTAKTTPEIAARFKKGNPFAKLDCNSGRLAPIGFGAPKRPIPMRGVVFAANLQYAAIYSEKTLEITVRFN